MWPAIAALIAVTIGDMVRLVNWLTQRYRVTRLLRAIVFRHFYLIILVFGLVNVFKQYRVADYLAAHQTPAHDYFAENYVNPGKVKMTAQQPRSLLLIYVESLESTYSDTSLFRNDLLQRLTKFNNHKIAFKHFRQMPGASWSIAGIVSSQCGLPLKLVTMIGQNRQGEQTAHFLPQAICLGDILKQHGYKNIYMNGSDVDFAGVGKFFKDHGYDELYGREYWLQTGLINKETMTGWGLPDDKLLQQAKLKLQQLMQGNQPFNLTLFTIDTHGLTGQLSTTCAENGFSDFSGIVECTANMVSDLAAYAKQQGWLDRMDIVIMGDHLAMKNLDSKFLEQSPQRYVFGEIIGNNAMQKQTDDIDHFDMLPTILTALGFDIEGGRLGLGYVRIGKNGVQSNAAFFNTMEKSIPYQSDAYNKMWLPNG